MQTMRCSCLLCLAIAIAVATAAVAVQDPRSVPEALGEAIGRRMIRFTLTAIPNPQ